MVPEMIGGARRSIGPQTPDLGTVVRFHFLVSPRDYEQFSSLAPASGIRAYLHL